MKLDGELVMIIEKKKIPQYSRYEISIQGEIINSETGRVVVPIHNNTGVLIVRLKGDNWKWMSPTVARLVLSTFKPLDEEWKYSHAYVNYRDKDRNNVALENIDWCFTSCIPLFVPGGNISYDDFVIIRNFPKYEINANGIVRHRKKGTVCQGYQTEAGYVRYNLTNTPNEYTGVQLHRLLALTFLEHPVDTDHLVVNHKDGNPAHNWLSNLEWTTYAGNNIHAYKTGLRSENIELLAMNEITKEVKYFHSFGACARFFNTTPGAVHSWCNRSEWKPYNGYWIKKASSNEPWPTSPREFKKVINEARSVSIKNIETNETHVFTSALAADKALGFRHGTSQYRAFYSPIKTYQNFLIQPTDSVIQMSV